MRILPSHCFLLSATLSDQKVARYAYGVTTPGIAMADDEELAPPRKIFVHNVGAYFGSNMCKVLAAAEERFEVVGTLSSAEEVKPRACARVVDNTPDALVAAFHECEMTVLDLLGQPETAVSLLEALASTPQFETDKVLVGLSSVMTWTRTSADVDEPGKPLTEEEYKRRRPHTSFREVLALEKMVTKSKRTGLRTHVVAAGLTYGMDEDLFHSLFKSAWSCEPLPLLSVSDGSNVRPPPMLILSATESRVPAH